MATAPPVYAATCGNSDRPPRGNYSRTGWVPASCCRACIGTPSSLAWYAKRMACGLTVRAF